jgi:hypothetical protein
MPRAGVDKHTATACATKKHVDNECLIWFAAAGVGATQPVEN